MSLQCPLHPYSRSAQEWIKSRSNEDDAADPGATDATGAPADPAAAAAEAERSNDPAQKFIRAPSDSAQTAAACPICQERFETSYREDLQDWVWMDAERVGGRVYHASCYADFKRDGSATPMPRERTATPDSVLGKRKAQVGAIVLEAAEDTELICGTGRGK